MRHLVALLVVVVVALSLSLLPATARAQWTQSNGPGRAPALLVHSDGVRLQVGLDQQGVYLSTDQGANWEFTNGGQFSPIAGMSAFGSQIYAGGFQGLIRSTDGGQSWSNRIDVLFIGSLDQLTSFALDGSNLYASTIASPGSGGSGVIRSTDQGLTWQPANTGIAIEPGC